MEYQAIRNESKLFDSKPINPKLTTIKQLLSLKLVKVTVSDIVEAQRRVGLEGWGVKYIQIPKWCFNTKAPFNVLPTEFFLQFVGEHFPEETYLCFDVKYMDPYLSEESSNISFDSLSFIHNGKLYASCKDLNTLTYLQYLQGFGEVHHFVIEIVYEEEDCEFFIDKKIEL